MSLDVLRTHAPSTLLAALVAGACLAVNAFVPLLSAMLVAIIVGALMRNLGRIPASAEPGIAQKLPLRLGVVLLGLRLSVPEVVQLGPGILVVIVATVVATYLGVLWVGRALRIPRPMTILVATGSAICGAAAVAAMSSVLRSEDGRREGVADAAATAVATVTLFGTAALLLVPALADGIGLNDEQTGVWIGAAVHEVGQVVAGAGLAGAGAMTFAVVTKLGRVVLLAPLVATVGWWEHRSRARDGSTAKAPTLPWFVVGFLLLVALRSVVDLPRTFLSGADLVATFLLTMGMFGMGAGVRIRHIARTGRSAMLLGVVAAVVSMLVPLLILLAIR